MSVKHFIWIFAFAALTFTGDRLGGWIFNKVTTSSQFRYSRLYNGEAAADILLMGNSRGLIFYQPYIEEKTGKSTFNFSYNGLPIALGYTLLEDYLDRYDSPKVLLLDVTMCDRENRELISGFNMYRAYSENIESLIQKTNPEVARGGSVSHLYRYNGEVFQRTLRYLSASDEDWLTDRVILPAMVRDVDQAPKLNFDLAPQFIADLAKTVKLAQSRGLKVELLVNPYYPPFADRFLAYSDWLEKIEEATGIKVKDYSQAINKLDAFGDYQHLNKAGARMYIDQLQADGIFAGE